MRPSAATSGAVHSLTEARWPTGKAAGILLGHGDGDLGLVGFGERDHRLTDGEHLAGLGADRGDEAGLVGDEHGVSDRVRGLP